MLLSLAVLCLMPSFMSFRLPMIQFIVSVKKRAALRMHICCLNVMLRLAELRFLLAIATIGIIASDGFDWIARSKTKLTFLTWQEG